MSRSAARIAKAGESAIRAVHRLARTESQETAKEIKRENKRKILLGCAVIEMMMKDSALCARVESFMRDFLERPNDIRAFELTEPVNYFAQLRRQDFPPDTAMVHEVRVARTSSANLVAGDAPSLPRHTADRLGPGPSDCDPVREDSSALHTPSAAATASS
jgi:hypothetical protein